MAWAKNGTPDTLSSSGDELQIADLGSLKFNQFMSHVFATGGNVRKKMNFNNDGIAGSAYAYRKNQDGGTDSTSTSAGFYDIWVNNDKDDFAIHYVFADSSEEKLIITFVADASTAGATTAPNRLEFVGKDATTDALTQIDYDNDNTGSYNTGSNLSALGTD